MTIQQCKVINSIEPFTQISDTCGVSHFLSCGFGGIFSFLNYFKISIFPFIVNFGFQYKINLNWKENKYVLINYIYFAFKPIDDLLEDLGIRTVGIYSDDNKLLDDIKSSISNDHPVTVAVDLYNQPFREDWYMKKHGRHATSIYGYDDDQKVFYVLEDANNIKYSKEKFSYDDFLEANKNVFSFCGVKKGERPDFYEFSLCKRNPHDISYEKSKFNDYLLSYSKNMLNFKDEIIKSLDDIYIFINFLEELFEDEVLMVNKIEKLYETLQNILNRKRSEKFIIFNLFQNNTTILGLIDSVIEGWAFLRSIIVKYSLTKKYNKQSFQSGYKKLLEIYSCEKEYYGALYQLLNLVVKS